MHTLQREQRVRGAGVDAGGTNGQWGTFVHGCGQGVPQTQRVLSETVHIVFQHPKAQAFPTETLPHKHGVHHGQRKAPG